MRVCGVICEYNPFHNGHAHQLLQARRLCNADYMVCVMSGPFVQRGGPAILDKWTRAQQALLGGADLVLELPALFAVRPAQDFAWGGVALLHGLGIVTHLSFGSESSDLALLTKLAAPESAEQSQKIQAHLAQGLSHPAARARAQGVDMPPNVTLGVEYMRALARLDSPIKPLPIPRMTSHHDTAAHEMASATAIRMALDANKDVLHTMPPQAFALLNEHLPLPLLDIGSYSDTLLYLLRTTPPQRARTLFDIPEGLENRLNRAAFGATGIGDVLEQVKCKRYPMARLRRLLVHMLLGIDANLIKKHPAPEYARVLGFKKSAAPLMRAIKDNGQLPLITKAADAPASPMLALDFAAQDIWDLAAHQPAHRDFTQRLAIVD